MTDPILSECPIRIKGDLFALAESGMFNIIVHGCNCFHTMGGVIASQIKAQYPRAYEADLATPRGDKAKLGTYSVALGKQFNIVNAYTQYGFAKQGADGAIEDVFEYAAFQKILDRLSDQYPTSTFGFPLIGQGPAGGNADVINSMISKFAVSVTKSGGRVYLVEYQPK